MIQLFHPDSFLGRWLAFFLDALLISVTWAVCCIPVVTIGAATAALYRVAINWMRDRTNCDVTTFLRAFRENGKKGTIVWLWLLVPLLVILSNGYLVFATELTMPGIAKGMVILTLMIWMATAVYAFALQAVFENTPRRTVGNALRIAASHITTTLVLLGMFAFAVFCTWLFPLGIVLYIPVCVFLAARPTWNVFMKVMERPEVQSERGAGIPSETVKETEAEMATGAETEAATAAEGEE